MHRDNREDCCIQYTHGNIEKFNYSGSDRPKDNYIKLN
jgi:hypothetical protein